MTRPAISVVVPVYCEEESLPELYRRLTVVLGQTLEMPYEILFVDDGSSDKSWKMIESLHGENPNCRGIRFSRNFGHQAALIAGLEHAQGEIVVTLDADLQDPPEIIEAMVQKSQEGYELVFGVRKSREKDTLFKRFTARTFYRVMLCMGVKLIYDHADYRLISRKALNAFRQYGEVNCFLRGVFAGLGFKSCIVEYSRPERYAGVTKYPLKQMVSFALEGITSFSLTPLRVAFVFGLCIVCGSIGFALWAVMAHMVGLSVPRWALVVLPLYALGGIQLLFLGITGEYVGKTYMEAKRRPRYIIQAKIEK